MSTQNLHTQIDALHRGGDSGGARRLWYEDGSRAYSDCARTNWYGLKVDPPESAVKSRPRPGTRLIAAAICLSRNRVPPLDTGQRLRGTCAERKPAGF